MLPIGIPKLPIFQRFALSMSGELGCPEGGARTSQMMKMLAFALNSMKRMKEVAYPSGHFSVAFGFEFSCGSSSTDSRSSSASVPTSKQWSYVCGISDNESRHRELIKDASIVIR